jgi:tRNA(fMet)-specific endonuclease VapC
MKYLLDTNTSIYYLNGKESVVERVAKEGAEALAISTFSLSELYYGAYRSSQKQHNLRKVKMFGELIGVLPCDIESAQIFGEIKAKLRSKGQMIEDFDIGIASIALKNGLVLVTNDISHFRRIDKLKIETWFSE